jgi:hypothetical protein
MKHISDRMPQCVLLASVCVLFACVSAAQTVVRSFDGDSGPGLAECQAGKTWCGRQSETNVAANGRQVVQVTWQNVRIYDYNGKLLQSIPMATFVRNAGMDPMPGRKGEGKGPFEPHVLYDEFVGRWLISVTAHSDSLLVSASGDATGKWGGVYPGCLDGGPCLDNDPGTKLGYDRNGVYYCGAHLNEDNPETAPDTAWDCFAFPAAEVKSIAQGVAPIHINRAHRMPIDVVPAIDNNPNKAPDAPAFFLAKSCERIKPNSCGVSAGNFPFQWLVNTFTWNGLTGTYNKNGTEQVLKTEVGSTADKWVYNTPCCGPASSISQKGSEIELRTGTTHHMSNAMQLGSHLYVAEGSGPCTKDCGTQGADTNNILIYADLDCSKPSACVVSQTAKLAGADVAPEFGTVGVDSQGNVGVVASSSTSATYLGVVMWWRTKADAPNTFHGPTTIAAGTQPYTCMKDHTLDSGQTYYIMMGTSVGILTARDPRDPNKLWTTQQYSDNAAPCVYSTRILQYDIASGQSGSTKRSKEQRPAGQ